VPRKCLSHLPGCAMDLGVPLVPLSVRTLSNLKRGLASRPRTDSGRGIIVDAAGLKRVRSQTGEPTPYYLT
jgi:hypothetical protein